jgi:hypothetical protein
MSQTLRKSQIAKKFKVGAVGVDLYESVSPLDQKKNIQFNVL